MTLPELTTTLESYLRLTTAREQAIATNMANVDTPGYRTRDIDFQGELHRALSESSMEGAESTVAEPTLQEVPGLMERPDGNNVSLDREGLELAETQLQYQTGVQLIKLQFHEMLSAINGGN